MLPDCKMPDSYPSNVTDKILQITLSANTFAFMAIDETGVIVKQGGNLVSMGLPAWELGENLVEKAYFLAGMLPMVNNYELLPSMHTSDSEVVDIHLFQDTDLVWIILENKTMDLEWEMIARQKTNELRLLQQTMRTKGDEPSEIPEIAQVFQSLNMVAMSYQGQNGFRLIKPVAPIFSVFYSELFENGDRLFPQQRFLFLENFLGEAKLLWESKGGQGRLRSGPWVERSEEGDEVALEAIALTWEGHDLLIIELLEENYQKHHLALQLGREGRLNKDMLEREIRKATRQIREREEEIALRLVCAADSRDDGESGSHIRRLGLYSEVLARHLGWEQSLVDAIRVAAPMHDIGKIGIPDNILKKPEKLSAAEFDIMKSHPEIGARILSDSNSELVNMARDIALGHHEKWDGSGYPFGHKGADISISARIVAIVDVFDALIHKRVYKEAMTVDKALEIMAEGRGSHFDPQLFDLFIELRDDMERIAYEYVDPIPGSLSN